MGQKKTAYKTVDLDRTQEISRHAASDRLQQPQMEPQAPPEEQLNRGRGQASDQQLNRGREQASDQQLNRGHEQASAQNVKQRLLDVAEPQISQKQQRSVDSELQGVEAALKELQRQKEQLEADLNARIRL